MSKPLILITNDDGITSIGIRLLAEVASQFAEVVVVAPNKAQSAMSHAITVALPLFVKTSIVFYDIEIEAYACSGTPADCIKLAKHVVLKDRKPDLVLSGVNHGSNTSISTIYSGTIAGAMEAAMSNIPAIGFSYCNYDHSKKLDHLKGYIQRIITKALKEGLPENIALNINFPDADEFKGVKVCRQAKAKWDEEFDHRQSPFNADYYWLAGDFVNMDDGEDTDEWAIENGYISIVPCQFDFTAYQVLNDIANKWSDC